MPTLNELSCCPGSPAAAGFNSNLQPARSDHIEIGVKSRVGEHVRLNFAAFRLSLQATGFRVSVRSGPHRLRTDRRLVDHRFKMRTAVPKYNRRFSGRWIPGLGHHWQPVISCLDDIHIHVDVELLVDFLKGIAKGLPIHA
ncbi:MAG TPA: hypothetical protein VF427_03130, partial [Noviherbaspirillum sp.]